MVGSARRRGPARDWPVIDPVGQLVCLTVYRRGAEEVVRRLGARHGGRDRQTGGAAKESRAASRLPALNSADAPKAHGAVQAG